MNTIRHILILYESGRCSVYWWDRVKPGPLGGHKVKECVAKDGGLSGVKNYHLLMSYYVPRTAVST